MLVFSLTPTYEYVLLIDALDFKCEFWFLFFQEFAVHYHTIASWSDGVQHQEEMDL